MNRLATFLVGSALLATAALMSGCAGTLTKTDAALSSAKAQEDLKWGCFALQGAANTFRKFEPVLHIDETGQMVFAHAVDVVNTTCAAANAGKLQNAADAFAVVMDLAGQLAGLTAPAIAASGSS